MDWPDSAGNWSHQRHLYMCPWNKTVSNKDRERIWLCHSFCEDRLPSGFVKTDLWSGRVSFKEDYPWQEFPACSNEFSKESTLESSYLACSHTGTSQSRQHDRVNRWMNIHGLMRNRFIEITRVSYDKHFLRHDESFILWITFPSKILLFERYYTINVLEKVVSEHIERF